MPFLLLAVCAAVDVDGGHDGGQPCGHQPRAAAGACLLVLLALTSVSMSGAKGT